MSACKLVIEVPGGKKIWLNIMQMIKMERYPDGRFFVYMINGEIFEIDHKSARIVENCLEG